MKIRFPNTITESEEKKIRYNHNHNNNSQVKSNKNALKNLSLFTTYIKYQVYVEEVWIKRKMNMKKKHIFSYKKGFAPIKDANPNLKFNAFQSRKNIYLLKFNSNQNSTPLETFSTPKALLCCFIIACTSERPIPEPLKSRFLEESTL